MSKLKRPELVNQYVGYVVLVKKGGYKPCVGQLFPDDNDNFIGDITVSTQPKKDTLAEALACFNADTRSKVSHVFESPIRVNMMGVWQLALEHAEEKGGEMYAAEQLTAGIYK